MERSFQMDKIQYFRPKTLEEVLHAARRMRGLTKYVAGCTNIIPDMRASALSPKLLVDLSGLKGLNSIKENGESISIGALTTIAEIETSEIIRQKAPLLSLAAKQLGNPLVRNRATIGGNLADASPAADMAPPLLALEASIHTRNSRGGRRKIPLDKFFLGPNKTCLLKDEIITKITFSVPNAAAHGSYMKLGLRNATAISVVSLAVLLELKRNVCQKARVALGAVAPTPIRAYQVEKNLEGAVINPEAIQESSSLLTKEISPISDIRASAEYRRWVTSVLFRRAIREALNGEKK